MAVDLPAFERPANATSGTDNEGKLRKWLTVVKNRACHRIDINGGQSKGVRHIKNAKNGAKHGGLRLKSEVS